MFGFRANINSEMPVVQLVEKWLGAEYYYSHIFYVAGKLIANKKRKKQAPRDKDLRVAG